MRLFIPLLLLATGCAEFKLPDEHIEIEFDMHHTKKDGQDKSNNDQQPKVADLQKVQ